MQKKINIKKGNIVCVISGKSKGKTGEIIQVDRRNDRVKVKDVNILTIHKRPTAQDKGGIVKSEGFIHISNVMIADPKDNKPTRIGTRFDDSGAKVKFSKRSGEVIK